MASDPQTALPSEPSISINGVALTTAQAMTVRVALGSFTMSLQTDGLGDDEHGKAMTKNYLTAIRDIIALMRLS
jgi:hypothetical protein